MCFSLQDTGSARVEDNEDELEYTHPLDDFYMDSGEADTDQLSDAEQQRHLELEQETLTSDSGDPPLGIMDDGSLTEYWRARPKKMVEEPDQEALQQGRGNGSSRMSASALTHDGEKPSSVAKRFGQQTAGSKSATSATASITAPRPAPRPVPKPKPVVSLLLC